MSPHELSIMFFLQFAFILVVIRVVGLIAQKIRLSQVVSEMIAGVLIGPSLFGALFPDLHAQLFPKQSMPIIYVVSQVGLVIYMFLIGAEFSVTLIRQYLSSAVTISLAGILVPFGLGSMLALYMIDLPSLFAPEVAGWEAMLFTGAAMSITAFPMLARLIYERGLTGTPVGTLALAAGSMDDAAAWCILATVLASLSGNMTIAVMAIGGGLVYAAVVLFIGRPLLRRLDVIAQVNDGLSGPMFTFILMLLMLGAWFTDFVGIYAVFGAFLLGIAMPRGIVTRELHRVLEPVSTNFLLPLFFVYSGLNTRLGLVVTPSLWGITILVVLAACVGKGVTCGVVARLNGQNNRSAAAIGILMNARGLMELILLNLGLQRGVITQTLFTIMVIMAVVTTLMTSLLFEFFYGRSVKPGKTLGPLLQAERTTL